VMALTPGKRVVVSATGSVPEPELFDPRLVRVWWEEPDRAAAIARSGEPAAAPTVETRRPREPAVSESVKDRKIFDPPTKAEPGSAGGTEELVRQPEPEVAEGPPAPEGLAARPEIDAAVLAWKPVVSEERPVVEYGVYRRSSGETPFTLVGRVPTWGRTEPEYRFLDEVPSLGPGYQYAVAAAWRDEKDKLMEGRMSAPVVGSAADFRVLYTGGDGETLVNIVVEKLFDGAPLRQPFSVRKRNLDKGQTGEIGGPARVPVESIPGIRYYRDVDFSTGYRLADIVTTTEFVGGIPKKRSKIVIENDSGVRREVEQFKAPAEK